MAPEFRIFTNVDNALVDPKNFNAQSFVERERRRPASSRPTASRSARTVEYFRIPRDVLVICLGKSTYARCGMIVNVTPLEPEWEGHVTLEISQHDALAGPGLRQRGHLPVPVPARATGAPEVSYADRKGKYMRQTGVTLPEL